MGQRLNCSNKKVFVNYKKCVHCGSAFTDYDNIEISEGVCPECEKKKEKEKTCMDKGDVVPTGSMRCNKAYAIAERHFPRNPF